MQNISVYLNEKASNAGLNWQDQISHSLFRSEILYQTPKSLNELYQNLDLDIKNNVDAVLSIGGDGTAHTIIQRLAGTEIGLLVIPGGTANDLAKVLGSEANIKQITQTIRQNVRKKIDLISVNGVFMATNGGLGFAADVAKEINDLRVQYPAFKTFMKYSGSNVYSLFLAKKMFEKNIVSKKYRITSEKFSETIHSPLILINNQPVLGGVFEVAPYTNHQDGKFNLTIFKHENRIELISCMMKIFNGHYPSDDKNLVSIEASEVKIELLDDSAQSFFGDGEIFPESNTWNIKCYPNLLSVFSPKDQKDMVNLCTQVSLSS